MSLNQNPVKAMEVALWLPHAFNHAFFTSVFLQETFPFIKEDRCFIFSTNLHLSLKQSHLPWCSLEQKGGKRD